MNEDNLGGGFETSADEKREGILMPSADAFDVDVDDAGVTLPSASHRRASASASASTSASASGSASRAAPGSGSEERLLEVKRRLEMRVAELLQSHVIWFEGAVVASAPAAAAAAAASAETTSTASGH